MTTTPNDGAPRSTHRGASPFPHKLRHVTVILSFLFAFSIGEATGSPWLIAMATMDSLLVWLWSSSARDYWFSEQTFRELWLDLRNRKGFPDE